ncbi:hypothetical protein BJX61DRAFT_522869 [Aspergillus egyptiacus]|nr:hypothetical protein BJX61DRAFT_522869 [Aspergillus egyptiacus]
MAPSKNASKKASKDTSNREGKKVSGKKTNTTTTPQPRHKVKDNQPRPRSSTTEESQNLIEISETIPLNLQQLLLNIFKAALLPSHQDGVGAGAEGSQLDIKTLIQTIKSHLYNRDFDSAFADADEELLRAYALRWSATRALGYAGLFKSLLKILLEDRDGGVEDSPAGKATGETHVVCIGGGAGAEIAALAAAWRDLTDQGVVGLLDDSEKGLSDALDAVSVEDACGKRDDTIAPSPDALQTANDSRATFSISITAVDIADWSTVVKRLSSTILSPTVPATKSHPAPLLRSQMGTDTDTGSNTDIFNVNFQRLNVLTLPDSSLSSLFHSPKSQTPTALVTLMFTLNELFSTSASKATAFLLRITDLLQPGTILLVVDSPGSYSTLKLGKSTPGSGTTQERQYPMKFLLDHALLSVAKGKWDRVFSHDSRWWRRDAARLWYDVGEGAGLEDMRFQIHVYRRV